MMETNVRCSASKEKVSNGSNDEQILQSSQDIYTNGKTGHTAGEKCLPLPRRSSDINISINDAYICATST